MWYLSRLIPSIRSGQGPAKLVGLLQVFGFAADGSFFTDAGDDDLAEKLDLQVRQRLLEEFDHASGGFEVFFFKWNSPAHRLSLSHEC